MSDSPQHVMGVSDRVMGSPNIRYNPAIHALPERPDETRDTTIHPDGQQQQPRNDGIAVVTTVSNFNEVLATTIANKNEWQMLKDPDEWLRLQKALIAYKSRHKQYLK
jgi:hypothetical protein